MAPIRFICCLVLTMNKKDLNKTKDTLATKTDLANLKADIIKWMFIFWAGTVVLSGILKATGVL